MNVIGLKTVGKPYTGNLYVRFDEGNGLNPRSYSIGCLISTIFQIPESLQAKRNLYALLVHMGSDNGADMRSMAERGLWSGCCPGS